MKPAHTVSVSIPHPPAAVYAYLADPQHLPEWSEFITAVRPEGNGWRATTSQGDVHIRFSPRNVFGVLDHDVTVNESLTVHVPMRVVKNDDGAEVLFTVYRQDGMNDEAFERDIAMVRTDLEKLKSVLSRRTQR